MTRNVSLSGATFLSVLCLFGCDDEPPCASPRLSGVTLPGEGQGLGGFVDSRLTVGRDAAAAPAGLWVGYETTSCPDGDGGDTGDTGCDDARACYENSGAYLLRGEELCAADQREAASASACAEAYGHPVGVAGDVDGDGASDVVVADVSSPYLQVVSSRYCPAVLMMIEQTCSRRIASVSGGGGSSAGEEAVILLAGVEESASSEFTEARVWVAPATARGLLELDVLATGLEVPMAVDEDHVAGEGAVRDVTGDGLADAVALVVGSSESAVGIAFGPISLEGALPVDVVLTGTGSYAHLAAGDLNGDGYTDLALSRYLSEEAADVSVLWGPFVATQDVEDATLRFEGSATAFGTPVAIGGDVTGDGQADLAVGDQYYDELESGVGAVYLFSGARSGTLTPLDAEATVRGDQGRGQLGQDLAFADVTGDGLLDLVIMGETSMGDVLLFQGE